MNLKIKYRYVSGGKFVLNELAYEKNLLASFISLEINLSKPSGNFTYDQV
jgi:hypothetical protein